MPQDYLSTHNNDAFHVMALFFQNVSKLHVTMAKQTEDKSGYITYLSPTKPCRGGLQYEIKLQDGENSCTQVRGFGQDSYSKMQGYHFSKKPVRVELFKNAGYDKPSFNARCKIRDAVFQEVPWKYNAEVGESSKWSDKGSEERDIKTIIQNNNFDTYYTVKGRVRMGSGPVKVRDNGSKLKEDITLFDKTGHLPITLWNELWEQMDTGDTVSLTHVKLRSFREKLYLTSSPSSVATKVENTDEIPEVPETFEDTNVKTVDVIEFEVGLVSSYSCCKMCQKKVSDSDIRAYSYTCKPCHRNHPIDRLVSTYLLPVTIMVDGVHTPLTLSQDVGERDLEVSSSDELVDVLINTTIQKKGIMVKYNTDNQHIESTTKK